MTEIIDMRPRNPVRMVSIVLRTGQTIDAFHVEVSPEYVGYRVDGDIHYHFVEITSVRSITWEDDS